MVARIAPPTTPFNAVMPRLDIPEKAYIVGAETGKIHAQLGDNPNGPETVTITPPGGSPTRASIGVPAGTPRGVQSFATGGSLTVGGGLDPNDPNIQAQIASGDVYFDPSSNSIQSRSGYSSPAPAPQTQVQGAPAPVANTVSTDPLEAQRQAQQAAIDARGGVAAATGAVNAAKGAVVPLTQAQINANAGVVGAQGNQALANQGVVNATGGTFAPRAAQIGANGQVIDAQAQQTAAQRAAIQQAQGVDAQRLANEQAVQAASVNYADKNAVAQAQNAQNNEAYKYQLAGLSQPVAVDTPNGASSSNLRPGEVANLQTQQQLATTAQGNAEKINAIKLDQAQQIVALAGTDVAGAQQAAARVGLTVAQAQLLVDQAQNNAAQAGVNVQQAQNKAAQAGVAVDQGNLGVTQANLGLDAANLAVYNAATQVSQSQLPPAGMAGYVTYTNPFTGASQYMTSADAAQAQANDKMKLTQQLNSATPLAGFSDQQLMSIFTQNLTNPATMDGFDEGTVSAELERRGYTQPQAHALLTQAAIRAQDQTIQDQYAGVLFGGKKYNQLTPDQKVTVNLKIFGLDSLTETP